MPTTGLGSFGAFLTESLGSFGVALDHGQLEDPTGTTGARTVVGNIQPGTPGVILASLATHVALISSQAPTKIAHCELRILRFLRFLLFNDQRQSLSGPVQTIPEHKITKVTKGPRGHALQTHRHGPLEAACAFLSCLVPGALIMKRQCFGTRLGSFRKNADHFASASSYRRSLPPLSLTREHQNLAESRIRQARQAHARPVRTIKPARPGIMLLAVGFGPFSRAHPDRVELPAD
jgi:hypothetical protein